MKTFIELAYGTVIHSNNFDPKVVAEVLSEFTDYHIAKENDETDIPDKTYTLEDDIGAYNIKLSSIMIMTVTTHYQSLERA